MATPADLTRSMIWHRRSASAIRHWRAAGLDVAGFLVSRVLRGTPSVVRKCLTNSWKRSIRDSAASSHAWMPVPRSWSVLLPDDRARQASRRPGTSNAPSWQAWVRISVSSAPGGTFSRSKTAAMVAGRPPWRSMMRRMRPRSIAIDFRISAKSSCWMSRVRRVTALPSSLPASKRERARTVSRAAASSSSAVRSSITSNCGARSASSGKRRSSDWQKAWMVWIFMPPGQSTTWANSRRARVRMSASGRAPVRSARRSSRRSSRSVAHWASVLLMRIDISAAAALVKVRQRMRDGWVPASIRRSTRSVSTLVLPVPAEAPTQTEHSGSLALRCLTLGSIAREGRSMTLMGDARCRGARSGGAHSTGSPPPADHSWTRARWP